MKFIIIIPARYQSSRFPGKPLADIKGKPMIRHVYEQASKVIDTVVVATDDVRIADTVKGFKGKVVMTSADHSSGTDRCNEAIAAYEQESGEKFDVVINVQGDEPFIHTEQIEKLRQCFLHAAETEIATLIKPITHNAIIFNPNRPKVVVNKNNEAIYFSRSPIPYFRNANEADWGTKHQYFAHIGIYAYRKDVLRQITELEQSVLEKAESLEQLRWIENGYRIRVDVTDKESLAVDTPEDLKNLLKLL